MKHDNKQAAELERLAIFVEECGEAIQVVGKILRHGYESYHPDNPNLTNRAELETEIGHIKNAIDMLVDKKDINEINIAEQRYKKSLEIKKYLRHQYD